MKVFKLDFRQGLKSLLIWSLIVSAVGILFMSFFPSMQTSAISDLANAKLDGLPTAFLDAFGLSQIPDFSKIDQYFGYTFQYILLIAAFYSALLGSKSLIREESDGTIEYLYSQPLTRGNIYRGKLLSSLVSLFIFSVFVIGVHIAVLVLVNNNGNHGEVLWQLSICFIGMVFTSLIFLCLGIFFSVAFRNYKQAVPFSMGIVLVTYLLGIVSSITTKAGFLQYFSPIHYSMPSTLLSEGFNWISLLIGGAVILISLILGAVIYQRKDLRI